MEPKSDLQRRQEAGTEVERRLIECLMGFEPALDMRVRDIQFIARIARTYAFEEFSKASPTLSPAQGS